MAESIKLKKRKTAKPTVKKDEKRAIEHKDKGKNTGHVKGRAAAKKFEKAHKYRKYGGMIPYIMAHYPGTREFAFKHLYEQPIPEKQFRALLEKEFPKIPKEELPSLPSIKEFRKKLLDDPNINRHRASQLMMQDETEIFKSIAELNLFTERKRSLDESQMVVDKMFKLLDIAMKFAEKTGMPPDSAYTAANKIQEALDSKDKRLAEITKMMQLYGFMPHEDQPVQVFNFNTQNNQMNTFNSVQQETQANIDGMSEDEKDELRLALRQATTLTIREEQLEEEFQRKYVPNVVLQDGEVVDVKKNK